MLHHAPTLNVTTFCMVGRTLERACRIIARGIAIAALITLLPVLADTIRSDFLDEESITELRNLYGGSAEARGKALNALIAELQTSDTETQLKEVNRFFNQFTYHDDFELLGADDYWQTPVEFIGHNGGDCEDYVIAKYLTLLDLGVDENNLYLTYVKATRQNKAHMVLSYIASPEAVPLVLDNYNPAILPATQRTDLIPVYSFNGRALFIAHAAGLGQALPTDKIKNSRWEHLLKRIEERKP